MVAVLSSLHGFKCFVQKMENNLGYGKNNHGYAKNNQGYWKNACFLDKSIAKIHNRNSQR